MLHYPVAIQSRFEREDDASIYRGYSIDLKQMLAIARRQWRVMAIFGAVGLGLGLAYILTAVPKYTAYTNLLVDQSTNRVVGDLSNFQEIIVNEPTILSQVELLKSRGIASKVIDHLQLTDSSVMKDATGSITQQFKKFLNSVPGVSSWFRSEDNESLGLAERRQRALAILANCMEVTRLGRSYVLTISYTSSDAVLAARIAQSFAEIYLSDQLDSKYEASRRAGKWLQVRIGELRNQVLQSDFAVQKFRADHALITSDGRLTGDQRLTELNDQMTNVQAEVATAKAKLDNIQTIILSGDTNAVVNDALASTVITKLRTKYLGISQRESEISRKLGPNHLQAIRLRREMDGYRKQMFSELNRIAEGYHSDLTVVQAREASIRANVQAATDVSVRANETQVQLRELEREFETYRTLYQAFRQRYQESIQQQSFPNNESRIITNAQKPTTPSKPHKPLVLTLSLVFGLVVGSGIGAFRDFRDRYFRTGDQVRDELKMKFLGSLPAIKSKTGTTATLTPRLQVDRYLHIANTVSRYVLDHPISSFAEVLRSAKIACDVSIVSSRSKVIGIVSVLPGEGKSTISINFAELLSSHKSKVLLIDGDVRNPGLTRAVAKHATTGIVEVVIQERPVHDVILIDPETGLSFIPGSVAPRVPQSANLLSSPGMTALFDNVTSFFDYVVIDLPPLAAVVDARALSPRIDAFVFVVEWGETARRAVLSTLEANPQVAEKCVGVVLNKVDPEKMKLYSDFDTDNYGLSLYCTDPNEHVQ